MRQTRRRTQAGLTPGKDDNEVWRKSDRKDIEWFYQRIVLNPLQKPSLVCLAREGFSGIKEKHLTNPLTCYNINALI